MQVAAYILLATIMACSGSKDNHDSSEATAAVGGDNLGNAIQGQPQGTLPDDYEKVTFSTYAEVTAAYKVEVVLLVDTELSAEQKKSLAEGIDSLLKHIINSNWNISVAALDAAAYPTKFITKYANYADYRKQFNAALGAGKEDGTPNAQPPNAQIPYLGQPQAQPAILRAFIIVTDKSFADTNLEENKFVLAKEADLHLTKVYAILNSEGHDGFLNWKNEQDEAVLSRYGSLQGNYKRMLEEFSADMANTLRGIFTVPPQPSGAAQNLFGAGAGAGAAGQGQDVAIAQIKVFNSPDETDTEGYIHDSHYQVKKNTVFSRAKFIEGICVDVTLAK